MLGSWLGILRTRFAAAVPDYGLVMLKKVRPSRVIDFVRIRLDVIERILDEKISNEEKELQIKRLVKDCRDKMRPKWERS